MFIIKNMKNDNSLRMTWKEREKLKNFRFLDFFTKKKKK